MIELIMSVQQIMDSCDKSSFIYFDDSSAKDKIEMALQQGNAVLGIPGLFYKLGIIPVGFMDTGKLGVVRLNRSEPMLDLYIPSETDVQLLERTFVIMEIE